jgi:SAM-dependent methyltransferase/uncharacterized protein YbaR (Trm112 family)
MDVSLLRLMRCPFCDGKLTADCSHREGEDLRYGVLHCYCSKWPIVEGIIIFRRDAADARDEVLEMVEAGRYDDALKSCLSIRLSSSNEGISSRIKRSVKRLLTSSWNGRWPATLPRFQGRLLDFMRSEQLSALLDRGNHSTAREYLVANYLHWKGVSDYFFHRFSQPRYFVALSLISIISQPDRPLLDLACGCGHLTRALLARAEGQPVFGMDRSFSTLYVAKRWVAPDAHFVCSDADRALPFLDNTFSGVVCSDAFHYFLSKATCVQECERLTKDAGFFVMARVRNALVARPPDAIPLSVEGYQSLVAHRPHRLLADQDILARYFRKEGPCLARQVSLTQLAGEPTLSLVVSHRDKIFRDYGPFDDWPHAYGRLSINPLYVKEGPLSSGGVCLKRNLPSHHFEQEHPEITGYLPDRVDLPSTILESLDKQQRTPEMEELIARCVILGLPDAYV